MDQQQRFCQALRDYDPTIWFPRLRGSIRPDNPNNWFICFLPDSWGRWKEALFGVHFGFKFSRVRPGFRLHVGVENPLSGKYRLAFKEQVISEVRAAGITESGFFLQCGERKKLLEADPIIPLSEESWLVELERYKSLEPVNNVIARVVRVFAEQGAFEIPIELP